MEHSQRGAKLFVSPVPLASLVLDLELPLNALKELTVQLAITYVNLARPDTIVLIPLKQAK